MCMHVPWWPSLVTMRVTSRHPTQIYRLDQTRSCAHGIPKKGGLCSYHVEASSRLWTLGLKTWRWSTPSSHYTCTACIIDWNCLYCDKFGECMSTAPYWAGQVWTRIQQTMAWSRLGLGPFLCIWQPHQSWQWRSFWGLIPQRAVTVDAHSFVAEEVLMIFRRTVSSWNWTLPF